MPRICCPLPTMINNLPVKTLAHKNITIEGYSRAAVQTYWRVPEMNLGFDLGAQPWSFMGTPTWFVSHTHMDHLIALPVYVARRRMMKMEPPVIYLPEAAIEPMERVLRLLSRMDRGRLPCQLLPARPGEEIELSREQVVTVSATTHTVPSLGFVVWERRRKLKPEYQGLQGHQIRDLRLGGTEVTNEVRIPRLAYLGDSSPGGLDACPAMFEAEVLIMELTFVSPRHRKRQDSQVRPHAPRRFAGAPREVPQRVGHRQPFQHAIPSHADSRMRRQGHSRHARRPPAFVALTARGRRRLPGKTLDNPAPLDGNLLRLPPRRNFA